MKRVAIILIFFLIVSCKNEGNVNTVKDYTLHAFMEVDVNGDYESYFKHLTKEYVSLLENRFQTDNRLSIIDSLRNNSQSSRNSISRGDVIVNFKLVDTVGIENLKMSLYKYRLNAFNPSNESRVVQEKIIIAINENGKEYFMPYNPSKTPEINALIEKSFGADVIEEINSILKFKEFESNNEEQSEIIRAFENYVLMLNNEDVNCIKYLYPDIFEEFLIESNQSTLSQSQKLDYVKSFKRNRELNDIQMSGYYVEDIKKIECSEKNSFNFKYTIKVKENIYLPGNAIVIKEQGNYYFIEFDYSYLKSNFPNLFSAKYMDCLKEIAK